MATVQLTNDRSLPRAAGAPRAGSRHSAVTLAFAVLLALLAALAAAGVYVHVFTGAGTSTATPATPAAALPAAALPYAPHELVVGYTGSLTIALAGIRERTAVAVTVSPRASLTPHEVVLQLPKTIPVKAFANEVKSDVPNVTYAVPDYIAHIAGQWFPDEIGRAHV